MQQLAKPKKPYVINSEGLTMRGPRYGVYATPVDYVRDRPVFVGSRTECREWVKAKMKETASGQ